MCDLYYNKMQTFFEFLRNPLVEARDTKFDIKKEAAPHPSVKDADVISHLLDTAKFKAYDKTSRMVTIKFLDGDQTVLNSGLKFDQDKAGHDYTKYLAADGKHIVKMMSTGSLDNTKVNKGNLFEDKVVAEFQSAIDGAPETPTVAAVMKIVGKDWHPIKVVKDGGKNTKRPLHLNGGKITMGDVSEPYDIGRWITDVTVTVQKGSNVEDVYISCKSTRTINMANAGIKKIITDQNIASGNLSKAGGQLLKAFCIDWELFRRVFNEYNTGAKDEQIVDITADIKKSKGFNSFFKSAIGCGYILVHDNHVVEMTPTTLKKMTTITSAKVRYPIGKAKRVEILVKTGSGDMLVVFRNSDKGVYPNKVMITQNRKY